MSFVCEVQPEENANQNCAEVVSEVEKESSQNEVVPELYFRSAVWKQRLKDKMMLHIFRKRTVRRSCGGVVFVAETSSISTSADASGMFCVV